MSEMDTDAEFGGSLMSAADALRFATGQPGFRMWLDDDDIDEPTWRWACCHAGGRCPDGPSCIYTNHPTAREHLHHRVA